VTARTDSRPPTRRRFTLADVRGTYKGRDAWWTVFLVDPLAARLMLPIVNRTSITPNQVSLASFAVGVAAAGAFATGDYPWLVAGALLYHLSFVLDCIDGKIARLKGTGSVFGMWLDYSFDRYRVLVCAIALMYGQYHRTHEVRYVWLTIAIVFLDMLRYMDALQVYKLRREMKGRLGDARRLRLEALTSYEYVAPARSGALYIPAGDAPDAHYYDVPRSRGAAGSAYVSAPPSTDLHRAFFKRLPWWARFRDALMRHRIRPHLFSGIEFQMFIFIVGPLTTLIVPFIALSAVGLLTFELAIIYKLLLSTHDFDRELARVAVTGHGLAAASAIEGAVRRSPDMSDEFDDEED
jgi:phosphatidylglycerophosphate synthase